MDKRYSESRQLWLAGNIFGIGFLAFAIFSMVLGIDSDYSLLTSLSGIACLVIFIVLRVKFSDKSKEEFIDDSKRKFEKLGFNVDEFSFSINTNNAFKLDENKSEMIYVYRKNSESEYNKISIPFNKILDVTVNSNGTSLISTSKSGAIGGALIGGAIAGGVGSIIGSSVANKSSTEKVNSMSLVLTIDDLNNPIISFEIINSPNGIDKNSDEYKRILNIADEWFGKFTVIMKRNEKLNNIS